MEKLSKQTVLHKTHYGIGVYAHILRKYYPDEVVLEIKGRDCGLCRNPFNTNKETLTIFIKKENILNNALDKEYANHTDSENAIPPGDAFVFAALHYKQQGDELLQTLNKEMNLHIGEERNFYANVQNSNPSQPQSPLSGEPTVVTDRKQLGGWASFSFFKAPISNTKPHKAISLPDAYNYIVGNYAKERTEKLRAIADSKKARFFKAANFDYCTFSGTFSSRSDKALIKHSGLLCVDFDHLKSVSTLFNQLLKDEYFDTQLLFRSPSGDGLKWIISISPLEKNLGGFTHSDYFTAVANYIFQTYGVEVDKSGRDISRACFLPHDPQAYINPLYKLSTL